MIAGGLAIPSRFAGVAQLVEHHVANVVVVGSNPITRSSFKWGIGPGTRIDDRMCSKRPVCAAPIPFFSFARRIKILQESRFSIQESVRD